MKVLLGCEESGTVTDRFLAAGHMAISVDLLTTRGKNPRAHHQGDVMEVLANSQDRWWDLVILFPDCTAMATCGNRHYSGTLERAAAIQWTLDLWALAKVKSKRVALENPRSVIWPAISHLSHDIQMIQPYWFGHPVKKATGLALWNLKRLLPTNQLSRSEIAAIPSDDLSEILNTPNDSNRKRDRSVTFTGVADAMVQQWGDESFFRLTNGYPQRA